LLHDLWMWRKTIQRFLYYFSYMFARRCYCSTIPC
jgi:hypothetical protein